MNLYKYFIFFNKKFFKYSKSSLQTPTYNLYLFNSIHYLLHNKIQKNFKNNLIELSAYQHPTHQIIPFIIHFNYSSSFYFFSYLCFYKTPSSQFIYSSLYWLERELYEFFGVFIDQLKDSRNLLLDYNKSYNALLKTFPTSGFEEVYYDPFFDKVLFKKINFIEL